MILILSHKTDYTSDIVVDKLNQRRIQYYRLNSDDFQNVNLVINFYQEIKEEITSIWVRRFSLPQEIITSQESNWLYQEYRAFIFNYIVSKKVRIMSDPYSIDKAENKSLQLSVAKDLGFNIPKTIITGNLEEIIKFRKYVNNSILIKPIYMNQINLENTEFQIFSNILKDSDLENYKNYTSFPSIFQEYIDKEYEIRVTVVGNKIFSAKVDSQSNPITKVDWRREKMKFEKYELPAEIEHICFELLEKLNLSFGAIDLIKSKNGIYYFLEINPNGQWGWIQFDTDQPIAEAIIEWLEK